MLPILTYHTVGDYKNVLPAGINSPIEVFRSHMDYLYDNEYQVVRLDQMVEHMIHGGKLGSKSIAITFDDGYEDNFTNAYPILKKYGFPATIFLTVKYVNGLWESEKAHGGKIKGLSKEQILEMRREEFVQFGSHGYSHKNLLAIGEEEKIYEIRDSKLFLEDLLGEYIRFISYPFGAFDEGIKTMVRDAGYRAGFSVWNKHPDIYSIRRIALHTHDGVGRFRLKISPLYYPAKCLFTVFK